jgi:hypothetical protein
LPLTATARAWGLRLNQDRNRTAPTPAAQQVAAPS